MPVTPFHLGPGATFKAVGGRHFSFMVFGGAQVLMDIEPLVRIYLGTPILHGYSHTLLGAFVIGAIAAVTGKPISRFFLVRYAIPHFPLTWLAACTGAFVGTISHVLLDAIMHPDMHPWWPFSSDNALLGIISVEALHVWCLVLGILGALGVAARFAKQRRA
jgi:membrane-bound metal-dependent hydrolase YbcI (DUF457 family)